MNKETGAPKTYMANKKKNIRIQTQVFKCSLVSFFSTLLHCVSIQ